MGKKKRKITHFFHGIGISLGNLEPLARRRGAFGPIAVFRHPELGKIFVLNGEVQHVEAWAPLYHEPLVHLPAAFVRTVRDVLILGGGTLYAAAEVLKYPSLKRVVLLDHDSTVSQLASEHYEHARACFSDKRFTIVHKDAYSTMAGFQNQFDLIINDGADLITAASSQRENGFDLDLFRSMTRALKPNGVCADVIYRHMFERERTISTIKRLRERTRFALSLVFLPEYHGVLHILSIWGKRSSNVSQTMAKPLNQEQQRWMKMPNISPCVYYDPRFLHYYLYLPNYVKTALSVKKTSA
jgi:spermidine synthase